MDPSTLVPGENITRYLCLAFGTGWYLLPGTNGAPYVTLTEKYLLLNHNCYVGEMVNELYGRHEVMGSNPDHCMRAYFLFLQSAQTPLVPGHPPRVSASDL